MNALARHRRHPAAIALLLLLGLIFTGTAYSALAPKAATAAEASADQVNEGHQLFLTNCATCHGTGALGTTKGPNLAGVGAASVDFQMSTGRMPMAGPGVQAPRNAVTFTPEKIAAISAYVASLAPGPAIPDDKYTQATGDAGRGGEVFRTNCSMCHNSAFAGGALTRGKYAPSLSHGDVGRIIYEAMLTGPQSMPVFNDTNLSPQAKADVITYLMTMRDEGNPGGMALGSLGPVPEGLVAWIFGLGVLIGGAYWLAQKGA